MKTPILSILPFLLLGSECHAQMQITDALITRPKAKEERIDPMIYQDTEPIPFKSVTLAVVLSTLVPGAGELYAGNFETGKYAMMAEAAIWITYAAFYTHGNWVRQDAHLFAVEHAGTNFNSKGDQFDVNIGNYLSIDDYNQAKLRNRENDLLYTDPSYDWKWDSDADRIAFKNARIRSDEIYQNTKFVIAAAVVNRIFSAFSAGRATAAYNRKILIDGAWNFDAHPTSSTRFADGLAFDFTYTF
jgi:TM2 domain-containing membrane protein YozV